MLLASIKVVADSDPPLCSPVSLLQKLSRTPIRLFSLQSRFSKKHPHLPSSSLASRIYRGRPMLRASTPLSHQSPPLRLRSGQRAQGEEPCWGAFRLFPQLEHSSLKIGHSTLSLSFLEARPLHSESLNHFVARLEGVRNPAVGC